MEYCFKFYMLGLTFSFPWHYSDTEYAFLRHARVVRALYRIVPCPSALWFLHLCGFVHFALRKVVERNVVCEVSLFLSELIHS